MTLFFKLVLYFIPIVTYFLNYNLSYGVNTQVQLLKNNTENNSIIIDSLKVQLVVDLFQDKEYITIIFSYGFLFLSLITTFIIKKLELSLKFYNTKIELFNNAIIGELIILFFYSIWWIGMLVYSFLGEYKGQIMIRLGNWIILNLACTLLPVARNSIFSIFLGISNFKLLYIHRIMSILCIISVIIKFISIAIMYDPSFLFIVKYRTDCSPLMGTIASILFFICGSLSVNIIRRNYFELFYYSHRILSVSIILFSSLHYISSLYYVFPSIFLYFIDLIFRLYYTYTSIYVKLKNAGIEKYETDCTFIDITFLKNVKTYPGCYFFICFYKDISKFEWHPISMISNSYDTITFCTKNIGKDSWTGRLFNLAQNQTIINDKKVYIQGPYGKLSINYKNNNYENIFLIAGGIGITPLISVLEDINILYEKKKLSKLKKVYFFWIMKDVSLFDSFKKYFRNLNKEIFKFKIYITKNKSIFETYIDTNSFTFINERPNMCYILNMLFLKESKNNAIITCGPSVLTTDIADICNQFKIDISIENF